jgi:sialic acid synthase SpsE/sugar phosphate isomerase/epimerase
MSDSPYSERVLALHDRLIGHGEPCFIIAEAGINHNGSPDLALKLVDMAVEAGADAIKFQKRHLPSLYPEELLQNANIAEWSFQYMLPVLESVELSDDDFRRIRDHCDERGIRFMCTPWDEETLLSLEALGVPLYKVASADLINLPLIDAIADTGKPLVLSTGMASWNEIERTVAHLGERGADFAILHCVSTYPAPFENLNLRTIERLRAFGVPVGYSSHERGIAMPIAAVALGACIVEKHITLDRTLPGPDHAASVERGGIERMVRDIRNLELALAGGEKQLSAMELQNRLVLRKSLVAARDLPSGTVVAPEMVTTLGPGKGLSPQRIDELVGVTLHRDVAAQDYFTEGDLVAPEAMQVDSRPLRKRWGLKARFHDLDEILALKPQLVELHFSEEDLDHAWTPPPRPLEQQLVVHALEFSEQRLLDLSSQDDAWRERCIELVQRTIDRSVELGAHFSGPVSVVIHVGGMSMDEPDRDIDALMARSVDALRRLDSRGAFLLPENLPPRPWYLGGQWFQNLWTYPEHMVEVCQETGMGMTLDISHAQLHCAHAGTRLDDYVRRCLPYTRHLHLADASGIDHEGLQIGEGVVDWEQLLELLADDDFTWVPEIWSGHLHGHAGFVHAVNRLAAYGRL